MATLTAIPDPSATPPEDDTHPRLVTHGNIMNRCAQWIRARFGLAGKFASLRSDERGSVMLLAAMMVFVATIFAVIAFDTNQAIYNRIIAQNAVDSAADSAALWQARGCNLVQLLNNLHYDVDIAAAVAESVAAAACVVSTVLRVAENIPYIGVVAKAIRPVTCIACDLLPVIDGAQQAFYEILMPIQEAIVQVTPFLAFANANVCAKGSGADPLLSSVLDAVSGILSKLGLSVPGFDSIAGAISGGLDWVPIYAAPIDPSSLKLYVEKKDTDDLPWDFPSWVGEAGDIAGQIGCSDYGYPDVKDAVESAGWDSDKWGWDDQYYFGNPGFMTWIAGKKKRDELLGLGNLRWLNGGTSPGEVDYRMGQRNVRMYTGSAASSGNTLTIPAFIALASSQVEGTPVISHGDVNAAGKLIKVYFSSSTEGETFLIYH